jgi:hypothetical protein
MRKWLLVSPDWEALDTVWKQPLPFILWPVCGKPLLAYWLNEALRGNADSITVLTQDRPHLVRAWLEKGDYWSREIKVISNERSATWDESHQMDSLPGTRCSGEVTDGRELLERWFTLHAPALNLRETGELVIDRELSPGVWMGPGATIHPSAKLVAPCWIGPRARIGARCRLGPNVYVSNRAVLDIDVEASEAIVCADTYVGRHTNLHKSAAQGGLLLNWKLGVSARIVEEFILADLSSRANRPRFWERLLAALLRGIAAVPARLLNSGRRPAVKSVASGDGKRFTLRTWPSGPLLLRREQWLQSVVAGRLKLFGVLPRSDADWEAVPPEIRALLQNASAGVFALSDLYNCHDPTEPDEWLHAAYQAGAPKGLGKKQTRRAALNIALKTPLS